MSEYTYNLVKAILKSDNKNSYKLFYNCSRDLSSRMPQFGCENAEIIKTGYPNKIFNYIMQKGLSYPKIDRLLDVDLFFMPHINFAALSDNVKKIITIHDLSFIRYPQFFSGRKNLWHKLLNVNKLLRDADKIIAVSENTKKDLIELLNINENKINVIYSGIPENCRRIDDGRKLEAVRKKYKLPPRFILFLSTIEPRKNVSGAVKAYELLIDAHKNLNDYDYVISGALGWKSRPEIKSWQNSKYKNKIHYLGYIENNDKASLYSLAGCFIYPSFYEGFGLPPLEAIACGCPVVASSAGSLPEILGQAALLINPYNISEISEAMSKILTDINLKNSLISKQAQILANFKWEVAAKKYLEIFDNLTN